VTIFPVGPEGIELQALLKRLAWVPSGGAAKHAIQGGEVAVNGHPEVRRARRLRAGDVVAYAGRTVRLVERDAPAKP
jgi:ribosome-associated protein